MKAVSFEKSNIGDLREKLTDLLNDSQQVEGYKKEASDYICSKYNWDDVTEQTMTLYERK